MSVSLYLQCKAVAESLMSAESLLKDERAIHSEGDWRTQQALKKRDWLLAAFNTLDKLRAKELADNQQTQETK